MGFALLKLVVNIEFSQHNEVTSTMKKFIANLLATLAIVLAGVGFLFATVGDCPSAMFSLGFAIVMLAAVGALNRPKQNRSLSR